MFQLDFFTPQALGNPDCVLIGEMMNGGSLALE
jgi:hypothetical protein